jgi:hypothetical protein
VLLAAPALVVLAGCSSSPSASTSSTTTTGPTTTSTTRPSGSTTTTASGGGTTTTRAGLTVCPSSQLTVTPQTGQGAAGTIEMSMTMVNHGSSSCLLDGYPGLQLLDANGHPLPTNVVRGGGPTFAAPAANQPPAQVVLAPGATAAFSLSYEDVPVGTETTCPTSSSAEVTPPNDYTYVVVPLQIAPCGGGTIHVSPVYAAG